MKAGTVKKIFSILVAIALVFSAFAAFLLMLLVGKNIFSLLLPIFYVSSLLFLYMWNASNSKIMFIPLGIALVTFGIGAGIGIYKNHISKIPVLYESDMNYRFYPFDTDSLSAKLDGESTLKIERDFPILDGATALFPVYAAFVQAVYAEEAYRADTKSRTILQRNTTPSAYKNLLDGTADIIFCAAPSDEQTKLFAENGKKLILTPLGKDAFVFFVNKNNPIDEMTIAAIKDIYSGKITNWEYFGLKSASIRAFQRNKNSGSQTMLEKIMGTETIMEPIRANVSNGMGEMIREVVSYKNFDSAIGYSFLHFATKMVSDDEIKLLAINNIAPSRETIRDGTYPFSDYFYAITTEKVGKNNDENNHENSNENVHTFIQWMVSTQGQELIEKTGYVAIQ